MRLVEGLIDTCIQPDAPKRYTLVTAEDLCGCEDGIAGWTYDWLSHDVNVIQG